MCRCLVQEELHPAVGSPENELFAFVEIATFPPPYLVRRSIIHQLQQAMNESETERNDNHKRVKRGRTREDLGRQTVGRYVNDEDLGVPAHQCNAGKRKIRHGGRSDGDEQIYKKRKLVRHCL